MIPSRRLPLFLLARSAGLLLLLLSLSCGGLTASAQQAEPVFSQIIVFGDSLSDTGNVRDRTNSQTGGVVNYPSGTFNYSDGRFTNSSDTNPSSITYVGVWHEQLARTFLHVPPASHSLGGGTDYAFGGATTANGTRQVVVVNVPLYGDVTITIDDMGTITLPLTRLTRPPFTSSGAAPTIFSRTPAPQA